MRPSSALPMLILPIPALRGLWRFNKNHVVPVVFVNDRWAVSMAPADNHVTLSHNIDTPSIWRVCGVVDEHRVHEDVVV